jgi:hypothetical protein
VRHAQVSGSVRKSTCSTGCTFGIWHLDRGTSRRIGCTAARLDMLGEGGDANSAESCYPCSCKPVARETKLEHLRFRAAPQTRGRLLFGKKWCTVRERCSSQLHFPFRAMALPDPHIRAEVKRAQRVRAQVQNTVSAGQTAATAFRQTAPVGREIRKVEASTRLRRKTRLVRKLAPIAFSHSQRPQSCSQRKRSVTSSQMVGRRLDRRLGCGRPPARRTGQATRAGPSDESDLAEPPSADCGLSAVRFRAPAPGAGSGLANAGFLAPRPGAKRI